MVAGSTLTALATVAAWLALAVVGVLRAADVEVSFAAAVACAVVAGPVALAATFRTIVSVWLGPRIVTFSREDAELCGLPDAEALRAAAQLRGTMGGAGHLHRARLVFPAVAWAAALVMGMQGIDASVVAGAGPWPLVVAAMAALAAWLFPSRPYWYREVTGGGVIVSPPETAALVAARRAGARTSAHAAGSGQGA